jgi:hypothetical protein
MIGVVAISTLASEDCNAYAFPVKLPVLSITYTRYRFSH